MLRLMTRSSWYRLFRAWAWARVRGKPWKQREREEREKEGSVWGAAYINLRRPFVSATLKTGCESRSDYQCESITWGVFAFMNNNPLPRLVLYIFYINVCELKASKLGLKLFPVSQWDDGWLWYNNIIMYVWINLLEKKQYPQWHALDEPPSV